MKGRIASVNKRSRVGDASRFLLLVVNILHPFFVYGQHIIVIHGFFASHCYVVKPGHAFIPLGAGVGHAVQIGALRPNNGLLYLVEQLVSA